jgi:hypothetical protein
MLLSRASSGLLFAVACVLTFSGPALAAKATSSDEREVIARLQSLFDGLARRDKEMITAQLLPGGSATLMRNGKPVQLGFDALAERLSAPGTDTHEEDIYNPLVRVDDNIATIWTRYEFLLNGKVDHCGTDIVNLVKVEGRWLIAFIGDNSRTDCKK